MRWFRNGQNGKEEPSQKTEVDASMINDGHRQRMNEFNLEDSDIPILMRLLKSSNPDDVFAYLERLKASGSKPMYM